MSPNPEKSQYTILIIEDDEDVSFFLQQLLSREGYTVTSALDGETGLCMLAERTDINLVLLDWMMPGMSGLQVLDELAQQENAPPVMMLSAKGERDEVLETLEAGAIDYIQKPVTRDMLMFKVNNILRPGSKSVRMKAARRQPVNFNAQLPFVVLRMTPHECVFESMFDLEVGSVVMIRTPQVAKIIDLPWDFRFSLKVVTSEGKDGRFMVTAEYLSLSPKVAEAINKANAIGSWD